MSTIDTAHNGKQAMELIYKAYEREVYSYGLKLMDCSMPVMNGYDASDLIRGFLNQRNMPQPMIVATAGHTENQYINKSWLH